MSEISQYGYHGKILEVDLTRGRIEEKPLDPSLVAGYLGGRGLATRIFCDLVDPACDPLGPENVLVIATSPLIGTNAPTSCRAHMVFKSPLTGVLGTSNSGGTWGHAFKATGYDVLVVRGRAEEPVFLDIKPGRPAIIPAGRVWGKDAHETTEILTADAEPGRPFKVLCIGPAGENLVRIAAVVNDRNRVYGRSGPGRRVRQQEPQGRPGFGQAKNGDRGPGSLPVGSRPGPLPDETGSRHQEAPQGAGDGRPRRDDQPDRHAPASQFPGQPAPG